MVGRNSYPELFQVSRVDFGDYDAVIDNVAYTPEDCRMLLESLRGRMRHYLDAFYQHAAPGW
ncbi:MAG: hypothetical protein K6T78_00650 [Alicyclobacillus sp.]|nr:hypothetical protein [Alicyclobacillus sp.]